MRLYISDLDGTLLDSRSDLSKETLRIFGSLRRNNKLNFSFATARGIGSAARFVDLLELTLPIVLRNGTHIYDPVKKQNIVSNYLPPEIAFDILSKAKKLNINPLLDVDIENENKIYYKGIFNFGQRYFIEGGIKKGDNRFNIVQDFSNFKNAKIIAVILIGEKEELDPVFKLIKDNSELGLDYNIDYYSKAYWLEIAHKDANKRAGANFLKEYLNASKLICFGDNSNDIPLFEAADEKYAVGNAIESLKEIAT